MHIYIYILYIYIERERERERGREKERSRVTRGDPREGPEGQGAAPGRASEGGCYTQSHYYY